MAQRPFGHPDTKLKLDTVFDYANFYTKVLRNKPTPERPFKLHYLDAFAGTGEVPLATEMPLLTSIVNSDEFIVGSVRRALDVDLPFSRYVFSDLRRKNVDELRNLISAYPALRDRVRINGADANVVAHEFCDSLGPMDRALIFLDPFGNQVRWETLEKIARTKKVDLWYLFPAWIGVARQVKNSGVILKDAEKSIDQMFGPFDWRKESVKEVAPVQGDIFATAETADSKKIATADSITRFMIECMGTIFGGGVCTSWLPLGRNGRHYYSLLFACANPGDNAKTLAQRVAREIMTRK